MNPDHLGACPASAVVQAARMARTPLAIAEAGSGQGRIMFVNDAFASLVETEASTWVGRPLSMLTGATVITGGGTTRFDLAIAGASPIPVALSIAPVSGSEGDPLCLLCSLIDARGEGADAAIARDATLLSDVAAAAGALMAEAGLAASASTAHGDAADVALQALERQTADGSAA